MNNNEWIKINYKFISKWAFIWEPDRAHELISLLCIYLNKKWHKIEHLPQNEKEAFINQWLKNNSRWTNSDFNKLNKCYDELDLASPDKPQDDFLEIKGEYINQELKHFIIDLKENYNEEQVEKILKIREIYLKLDLHEKVLYDLYFTNMLSMRKIAKKIDIPVNSVYNMITDLKKKIKDLLNDN